MKVIETKYHGPTNTRGARITATTEGAGRLSIPYPHELSGMACHQKAAEALRDRLNWQGRLIGGGTKSGYAFVFADDEPTYQCPETVLCPDDIRRRCKRTKGHDGYHNGERNEA